MTLLKRTVLIAAMVAITIQFSTPTSADDWPQWMGKNRDGIWHDQGIVESLPAENLKAKWRTPISGGYSGPAVADGRVFVHDYDRKSGDAGNIPGDRNNLIGDERVHCLDEQTGELLWTHKYDCPYAISYPAGPRATPAVNGDHVYTLGAEGNLFCLNVKNGDVVWSHALKQDYKIGSPVWGFSAHPLIDGDKLICMVGGEGSVVVAFNKTTGKEIWRALTASEPGYCPPSIIQMAGKRQLVIWDADNINGLNPETGSVYWSIPLKPDFGMSIMQPRLHKNYLFASGIGSVGAVLKLDSKKPGAEIEWRGSNRMGAYCSNSTPYIDDDGVVYAVDCEKSTLVAFDLISGERIWETKSPTLGEARGRHGTAFLVKNGERFFLFSETGDLVLAKLSREKYDELGRTHLLDPTGEAFGRPVVWSHPAFANQCVFARNDKEIVCVSLAK